MYLCTPMHALLAWAVPFLRARMDVSVCGSLLSCGTPHALCRLPQDTAGVLVSGPWNKMRTGNGFMLCIHQHRSNVPSCAKGFFHPFQWFSLPKALPLSHCCPFALLFPSTNVFLSISPNSAQNLTRHLPHCFDRCLVLTRFSNVVRSTCP